MTFVFYLRLLVLNTFMPYRAPNNASFDLNKKISVIVHNIMSCYESNSISIGEHFDRIIP